MAERGARARATAALLARLDRDAEAREGAVRAMLTPAQRAEFDAGMEEIRSGRHALRMLWHSLSEAQRRVVESLEGGKRRLIRCHHRRSCYDAHGDPHVVEGAARTATVRVLVGHGVLHWNAAKRHPPEGRAAERPHGPAEDRDERPSAFIGRTWRGEGTPCRPSCAG